MFYRAAEQGCPEEAIQDEDEFDAWLGRKQAETRRHGDKEKAALIRNLGGEGIE